MKKFVALLLLSCASLCSAAVIAIADNAVGGKIVLTSEACEDAQSTLIAYTSREDGSLSYGCWMLWRGVIYIGWKEISEILQYDPSTFHPPAVGDES